MADASYSRLKSAGGSAVKANVIVINTGDGFIALSKICTYEGCIVSYDANDDNLPCGCHGSLYSTSCAVLNGPAEVPLKKYVVSQEGDILTIKL